MSVLRAIRSNRQLALLEASWAVVTFARWALMILVALYAYRKGGAAAVGVVAMTRVIPSAFTAPRLALFADAHSRRDVLLISCVVRGLFNRGDDGRRGDERFACSSGGAGRLFPGH